MVYSLGKQVALVRVPFMLVMPMTLPSERVFTHGDIGFAVTDFEPLTLFVSLRLVSADFIVKPLFIQNFFFVIVWAFSYSSFQLTTLQTTAFTISGAKFSVSSAPILHTTRKVSFTRNGGIKEGVDLGNIVSDSIEYLKKMLGLTPDCLNGGLKTLRG